MIERQRNNQTKNLTLTTGPKVRQTPKTLPPPTTTEIVRTTTQSSASDEKGLQHDDLRLQWCDQ